MTAQARNLQHLRPIMADLFRSIPDKDWELHLNMFKRATHRSQTWICNEYVTWPWGSSRVYLLGGLRRKGFWKQHGSMACRNMPGYQWSSEHKWAYGVFMCILSSRPSWSWPTLCTLAAGCFLWQCGLLLRNGSGLFRDVQGCPKLYKRAKALGGRVWDGVRAADPSHSEASSFCHISISWFCTTDWAKLGCQHQLSRNSNRHSTMPNALHKTRHSHTHAHVYIYIYVYIYMCIYIEREYYTYW